MSNDTSRTQSPRKRIEDSDLCNGAVRSPVIIPIEAQPARLQQARPEPKTPVKSEKKSNEAKKTGPDGLSENSLINQRVDDSPPPEGPHNSGSHESTTCATVQN